DRPGPWRRAAEALAIPIGALAAAMVVFGLFMAALGHNPLEIYALIYRGAFASAFSLQNTLSRAAPLVLTALCVALPAQAGLVGIGGGGGGARWPHRCGRRPSPERLGAHRREGRDGRGRHGGRRRLDRAGGRASPVSRRQRDDLEPAPDLRSRRAVQSLRRGTAARSG